MTQRIITLTTDFGTQDPYVGVMKGVILGITPQVTIVDITHHVPPQDVWTGAYVLNSAVPYFPEKSIHVAVVDPGVGTERRALAVRTERAYYVAPDNGVLSPIYDNEQVLEIVHLTNRTYWLTRVSHTFHGRDVFAPVAAYIARGVPLSALGAPLNLEEVVRLKWPAARVENDGTVRGIVVHVDHFGNIVTNIPASMLEGPAETWEFEVNGHRVRGLRSAYAEVNVGEALALIGSNDTLEFSIREGNAAATWGVRVGDVVYARRVDA